MTGETYVDPISSRYASVAMQELFSLRQRALTWRDLWIALAEAQRGLGLPITEGQIAALRAARDTLDLDRARALEAELRHDVMAHIHHYGEVASEARGILHLGATSCFVTDNADLIIFRRALGLLGERLLRAIHALAGFCRREAHRPTLGLTHLQPAQLTTVGKRAALWIQDMVDVWERLDELGRRLPLRGVKGTTGTQASFLQLLEGDERRVCELERRVAQEMGFEQTCALTGQTYPRLWDYRLLSVIGELAIALHKMSTDVRLLQSWGELEEPQRESQVGSTAMPYKRNPMRCERLGSLAKLTISQLPGVASMAATQWCERTLDDSALRRVAIPQSFLAADSMLLLARNIAEGLVVHPAVAERRVREHLPFIAAEEILMHGTREGGDRQHLHERIRRLSWQAVKAVREGKENPLRELFSQDELLGPLLAELPSWEPARFTGRAAAQTIEYLEQVVDALPRPPEDDLRELAV